MGWQNGSVDKGTCYQDWWPEFNPTDPCRWREQMSNLYMDAMAHECTPPINKCNTNLRRITWKDGYESHQGVHHTECSI